MSSISDTLFMIKYDFFKKEDIPQYAIVKIITIINMACLIDNYFKYFGNLACNLACSNHAHNSLCFLS